MINEKGYYRRVTAQGLGPGGWQCACCAPPAGKLKKQWKRMAKKKDNSLFSRLIQEALVN